MSAARVLPSNSHDEGTGSRERASAELQPDGIALRRFAGPAVHVDTLDHLRVAHLTDLHVGRMTPFRVQQAAVELTNREDPDLVVITGDFVCHSQLYLDALQEVIEGIDAPVVTVLGNHDHWSGADEVRRALRRAGAEVLDNAHTSLTLRHQTLQVVGVDDAYTGHASVAKATKGLRKRHPAIALSHIAEEADAFWARGVPLVFSGHTHAGQVTVARLHELAVGRLAGHRYVHGLYGSRDMPRATHGAVYVGAGIGSAVLPFRLGERARRELAVFELGHGPGAFDEHHDEQSPLRGRVPSARTRYRRAIAVAKKTRKRRRRAELRAVWEEGVQRDVRAFFQLAVKGGPRKK